MVRGRRRDIGLGGVSYVGLAEARGEARRLRKIAKTGGDPVAERRTKDVALTLEVVAREVHELLKPGWRKSGIHVEHWIASLERHVFPTIGDRPIDTTTFGDILTVLTPIWHKTPETARRVRQRLRQVMQWAKGAGHYPAENPVDIASGSLPRHASGLKTHLAAMPYEQVPDFMKKLAERSGVSALALRLTVLTAARSGEIRGARWSEIDVENAVWTIPAARMKSKKDHRVPLTAEALGVLEKACGLDRELVFPGQKCGEPMSDATLLAVLRRMKLGDLTVYGFRSTFRDWAAERTTYPREVAELCLAHEVGSAVERAFRRSDLFDERRQLMAAWARFCLSAGEGSKVVEFRS